MIFIAISCNKDKFTTVPQVSITSISPSTVSNGNIVSMKGNYTDKEGDIDSILIVYKWYNGAAVVKKDTFRYTFAGLNLPSKTDEADLSIDFQYNTSNPNGFVTLPAASPRDTTGTLGLILIDKAKNRSIYAESKQIRLKKP
jgi:hypothetical protein